MANDALAPSGIDVGLPQEAEYDAVYAAVTATERGRWFLTEFASRNRHADTDSLVDAIARIEAAFRSDAPAQESPRRPDISAAAERLTDIAFELRERAADGALCDALDAAVREICDACKTGGEDSGAEDGGAEVGGAEDGARLAGRKAEMTPDQIAAEPVGQIAGDANDANSPPHSELFDMPLQDTEKFAEAASALAASLSALAGETETANEPQGASPAVVVPQHEYDAAAAPPLAAAPEHGPRWHIEAPDFVFHQSQHGPMEGMAESADQSSQPHALLAVPPLLPSPEEDPADLFEPASKRSATLAPSAPVTFAAKPELTALASAASAIGQAVQATAMPPLRNPTGPTVRPLPRPAPVNPLAALRGLTEDELIALFG